MFHLTRRGFVKSALGTAAYTGSGCAAVDAFLRSDESPFVNPIQEATQADKDALKALMDAGSTERSFPKRGTSLEMGGYTPAILFQYAATDAGKIAYVGSGMAQLIHPSGLFLTAAHCLEDTKPEEREEGEEGRNSPITVLYHPKLGIARAASMYGKSPEDDIAVGKIVGGGELPIPEIPIYQGDIKNRDVVISLSYAEKERLPEINERVIINERGYYVEYDDNGAPRLLFKEKRPINEEIEIDVDVGQVIGLKRDGVKIDLKRKYIFEGEIEGGDSGSPVYSVDKNIAGVVIQSVELHDGRRVPVAAAPHKIRDLVQRVIES